MPAKDPTPSAQSAVDSIREAIGAARGAATASNPMDMVTKATSAAGAASKAINDVRDSIAAAKAANASAVMPSQVPPGVTPETMVQSRALPALPTPSALPALGRGGLGIGGPLLAGLAIGAFASKQVYDYGVSAADATLPRAAAYSPELAAAQAQADVRQIIADMRSARRVGPELADYANVRAEIAAQSQRFRDEVTKQLSTEVNSVLEYVNFVFTKFNDGVEAYVNFSNRLEKYLPPLVVFNELAAWLREQRQANNDGNFIDWFDKQPFAAPAGFAVNNDMEVDEARFEAIPGLQL